MTERAGVPGADDRAARLRAERAERRLAVLDGIAPSITASLDLDVVLERIAAGARQLCESDTAALFLREGDADVMVSRYRVGDYPPTYESLRITPGQGLGGQAWTAGRPVRTARYLDDPKIPGTFHGMARAVGAIAVMAVPILVGDRVEGLLYVGRRSPRAFEADDETIASRLAEQAAIAIQNARLFARERRLRREAEVLAGLAAELTASLDLDRVLQRVAEGTRVLCESEVVRIALREEGSEAMLYRYLVGTRATGYEALRLMPGPGFVGQVLRTGQPFRRSREGEGRPRPAGAARLQAGSRGGGAARAADRAFRLRPGRDGRAPARSGHVGRAAGRPAGARPAIVDHRAPRRAGADPGGAHLRHGGLRPPVHCRRRRHGRGPRPAGGHRHRERPALPRSTAGEPDQGRLPRHGVPRAPDADQRGVRWARMLRQAGLDAAASERALEVIERNARAQVQLIDDLLDVSRIVAGKMRLDVRPVEPAAAIEAALDAVRPAADAKGVHVHAVLDPRASPILGDPDRLQQIVWNLCVNAVKFTPKGGRVQVALRRVNSHVEITVSDSGVGIAPETLPLLFERFRQGQQGQGGLGIGLALVRHLVELHGGTVSAGSEGPGHGAVFVVQLPLAIAAPTPGLAAFPVGPLQAAGHMRLDGMHILIVDDDADSRDLARTILELAGATVWTAPSPVQALDQLAVRRPHVILSDIEMPAVDGYTFVRRLRALPRDAGGTIPVVALTAYGGIQDRIRALEAGFDMHVPKPVDPSELCTVVARLARRGS